MDSRCDSASSAMLESPGTVAGEDAANDGVLSFSEYLALESEREGGRPRARHAPAHQGRRGPDSRDQGLPCPADGGIARSAGLSHGAVYKYFQNKKHVTLEVLTECVERSMRLMLPDQLGTDAQERIHHATLRQVKLFIANVGLTRCIRQLGDELPEFNQLVLRTNTEWCDLVARGLVKRWQPRPAGVELAGAVAAALGAMVDELMHDIFVRRNPRLADYRDSPSGWPSSSPSSGIARRTARIRAAAGSIPITPLWR